MLSFHSFGFFLLFERKEVLKMNPGIQRRRHDRSRKWENALHFQLKLVFPDWSARAEA